MIKKWGWRAQLLIFGLLLGILHGLLYLFGRSSPATLWYRNDTKKLDYLDEFRRTTSRKALKDLRAHMAKNGIKGPFYANSSAKKLCLGIISVPRLGGTEYLSQTVAGLLTRENLWRSEDQVRITLYNVFAQPQEHKEALGLADLITVKSPAYDKKRDPKDFVGYRNFLKENLDHLAVLEDLYSQECENYLVLEDDALAGHNWADSLLQALKKLREEKWFMMKVFSPIRWIHWQVSSPLDILLIIAVTIAFCLLSILIVSAARFTWVKFRGGDQYDAIEEGVKLEETAPTFKDCFVRPTLPSVGLLLAGLGLFVVIIGKYTLFPFRDGIHDVSMGFSCVANSYPRSSLRLIIDHIGAVFDRHAKVKSFGQMPKKDLFFQDIVKEQLQKTGVKLRELVLFPNLFQHIGLYTSLDRGLASKETNLKGMCTTHHFPDEDRPIEFSPTMFYGIR